MSLNDLNVGVHTPDALESVFEGKREVVHGLPPFHPAEVHLAMNYSDVPTTWMPDGEKSISGFIVIDREQGLWLDFRGNDGDPYDVAINTSFQGVSTVTGLPTSDYYLQQYRHKCPLHPDVSFTGDRYCSKCGYSWAPQNYVLARLQRWQDGYAVWDPEEHKFVVRQWYFSHDPKVGIAAQILGEDRTPGIGIALFRSVEPKPVVTRRKPHYRSDVEYVDTLGGDSRHEMIMLGLDNPRGVSKGITEVSVEEAWEIGAGALIDQEIAPDPNKIDYWRKEPDTLMNLYFVTPRVAKIIFASRIPQKKDGPLNGLRLGRSPFGVKQRSM